MFVLSRASADGTTRHIVDILADGDCLYRALCVCWDMPQTQHYQLRERVAEHLMQLPVDDFKELCQRYDNIAQALQTATKHRIGQDSLVTDSATRQQVDTLSMHQWSDNTWINIRNLYIQHVVLHRGRYGGLLDIQAPQKGITSTSSAPLMSMMKCVSELERTHTCLLQTQQSPHLPHRL